MKVLTQKKYQDHFPCSFGYKVVCIDDRFSNKNLIMSEEEEHLFRQSNGCWICEKLIDYENEKVRDHCHVTGKFRGAAH